LTFPSGNQDTGYWKHGKLNGHGVRLGSDGTFKQGFFLDHKLQGPVKHCDAGKNRTVFDIYQQGKPIERLTEHKTEQVDSGQRSFKQFMKDKELAARLPDGLSFQKPPQFDHDQVRVNRLLDQVLL